MFSSVNVWKNIEAKLPSLSSNQSNYSPPTAGIQQQRANFKNLLTTSGYLYAYVSHSDCIHIGSAFDLSNIDDHIFDFNFKHDLLIIPNIFNTSGHSITDLSFHPLNDDILAISGRNSLKLYRLPLIPQFHTEDCYGNDNGNILIKTKPKRSATTIRFDHQHHGEKIGIDFFRFHPTFEELIAIGSLKNRACYLFDITKPEHDPLTIWKQDDYIPRSFDFDYIGRTVVSHQISVDQNESKLSLVDIRSYHSSGEHSAIETDPIKCWNKTFSRVLFLEGQRSQPYILLTLLDTRKNNNIIFFDRRNFSKPVLTHAECGSYRNNPSSIYIPRFDPDAGIIYLALKNGQTIVHCVVEEMKLDSVGRNPFDNDRSYLTLSGNNILDCALLSKRSLNVTKNQVDCLVNLTTSGLIPISYVVPQKTQKTFSRHLYPDTLSPWTDIDRKTYISDQCESTPSKLVKMISLDPKNRNVEELYRFGQKRIKFCQPMVINNHIFSPFLGQFDKQDNDDDDNNDDVIKNEYENKRPDDEILIESEESLSENDNSKSSTMNIDNFKYIKGSIVERKFINIPRTSYPNYEFFKINRKFAFFLTGDYSNRLSFMLIEPNGWRRQNLLAQIHCPTSITCFALDPFDPNRLAIGLSNGMTQLYTLPSDVGDKIMDATVGDLLVLDQPDYELNSVSDSLFYRMRNIVSIQFHTMAEDVMASCIDIYIFIWDIEERTVRMIVHSDYPLKFIQWNRFLNGAIYIASIAKHRLFVKDITAFDSTLEMTLPLPNEIRNYRLCWAMGDNILIVSAVDNCFNRKIYFFHFNINELNYLTTYEIDVSSSVLVPYFDEDTKILFLSGRGDSVIFALGLQWSSELHKKKLLVKPMAHFHLPYIHQAIDFWPKQQCDVRNCEVAVGFRLMTDSIDKFRYVVPRTYPEYFHDEIYPLTFVYSKPLFSSHQWFCEHNNPKRMAMVCVPQIDLKPKDMVAYSTVKNKLKADRVKQQKQKQMQLNIEMNPRGCGQSPEMNTMMSPSLMLDHHNPAQQHQYCQHKDALVEQISNLVIYDDDTITSKKQNDLEGVDSDEWED